jgi:hypothetical protein
LSLLGPGLLLVVLTFAGLALHQPGLHGVGSPEATRQFFAVMGVAGLVYLLAAFMVLRMPAGGRAAPSRRVVWVVLAVAVALRAPVVAAPNFLSGDLFRYVWDGRVQLAGINPYRYIPAAPELKDLRDTAIYPNINRADYAPTIYPPAAQMLFRIVAAFSQTPLAIKLAMEVFECVSIACLLRLLVLAGRPPAQVLIYAWNPLIVWTFAGNGHIDAAGAAMVALALLLRCLGSDGVAGGALALATLTKYLPIVIAPALWRRWGWRLPLGFLIVAARLYASYAEVGWRVLGFLPGYTHEEGIAQGSGLWALAGLAALAPLPPLAGPVFLVLVATGLGLLSIWIVFADTPRVEPGAEAVRICRWAALLATLSMIALSPHYPWYYGWLAVPACIGPWRCAIWLSVAPLLLHLNPLHEDFLWPSLVYVPALLLAVQEAMQRRAAPAALPRRLPS